MNFTKIIYACSAARLAKTTNCASRLITDEASSSIFFFFLFSSLTGCNNNLTILYDHDYVFLVIPPVLYAVTATYKK